MSSVETVDRPTGALCSAEDLRPLHLALLREWNDLDDAVKFERAEQFRHTAANAGAWIKSLDERDAVQGLIDYWTATMATLPDAAFPEAVLLLEFKQSTVQKARRKCPFVGLTSFELRDANHYFGREDDVDSILSVFERNAAAVISGPSGMGKTSLAQAGVAGRLAAKKEWLILGSAVPGRDPVAALLRAVEPNTDKRWLDEQRLALASTPEKFRELAEARLSNPEQHLLIIVDRAEELFASDVPSGQIEIAANAISSLIAGPKLGRHRVLFTIREDFLKQLRTLINSTGNSIEDSAYHELTPPGPESLRKAIVKPGEVEGFRFEDRVVEDLVNETANHPDALPLLQFTLTYLWKHAEVDRVGWAEYQQIPKPSQLLSDVAERTYGELTTEDAREVARVAFSEMIRLGQDVTVRRMRRDDLERCVEEQSLDKRQLRPVLDAFVKAGLLQKVPGENLPDDRFELSHSAVIRHWPRLLIWIQEKRRAEEGRERYTAAVERWRANGRSNRYLLPLWATLESGRHRGKNRALDEYITISRRWWMWVGVLLLCGVALYGLQQWRLWAKAAEARQFRDAELVATTQSREAESAGADFAVQAMLGDQTLLRALNAGLLPKSQVPNIFMQRLEARPTLPSDRNGYDEAFLGADAEANVPLPSQPGRRPPRIQTLNYPHTTVIYDTVLKIPLVVATNVDMGGKFLPPFNGVGFFPDPRLSSANQASGRVSSDAQFGRVSLIEWRNVGRASANSAVPDASFLNFTPFSVLQPWDFYAGIWSSVDQRLFATDAKRLSILTGPILTGKEIRVGGSVVPKAYWKAAVHWDSSAKKLVVQAHIVDTTMPLDVPKTISTLGEIAKQARLNFGRSAQNLEVMQDEPVQPTVYLQFAAMPRATAVELGRKLANRGYHLPPEELVQTARGLAEVRYVRAADADLAARLARDTEAALKDLGVTGVAVKVQHLDWVRDQPPAGVLELWIGLPELARDDPVAALPANRAMQTMVDPSKEYSTYVVHGADDGFLVLRSQPNRDSAELTRMEIGEMVKCGDVVAGIPGEGWRPCSYNKLNGFAFDAYLLLRIEGQSQRRPSGRRN